MATNTDKKKNPEFILKNVRLSFPHIFEPKAIGDGVPRYTANFLLDPADAEHKEMIRKLRDAANALYAEGTRKPDAKPKAANCALKKGNDEDGAALYDGYEKMWFVSAARALKQGAPLVVGRDAKTHVDHTIVYAGCYVNAKIRLYFHEYDGVKRVNASIEAIQFYKKGDPFGNGPASAYGFEEVEGEEDGLESDNSGDDDDL